MIISVEMGNFLSHIETKVEFEEGVTVFVGENGAGKSSVIDAITFALFGQHTRKSNKGLVRRGANQGFAKVNFLLNGRQYEAVRKIDHKGVSAATFSEKSNGSTLQIAAGERRQFGESMTGEVERRIGLDFEKLRIASIVRQGELDSIIKARPKEFKELLNAVIGIDKLDIAPKTIKDAIEGFRAKIRKDVGYDDTHIETPSRYLKQHQDNLNESIPVRDRLRITHKRLTAELESLERKIYTETPKVDKIKQLQRKKQELQAYAQKAIGYIQHEISEGERKIRECEGCFGHTSSQELESDIQKTDIAIQKAQGDIQMMVEKSASLKEKLSLAERLQLKDSRCPVCDSKVSELNPLFQEDHLREELVQIGRDISEKESECYGHQEAKKKLEEKLRLASDATATLKAHAITKPEDLARIKREVEIKKSNMRKIPSPSTLSDIAGLDSYTRNLFDEISKLEEETAGFDEDRFNGIREERARKNGELARVSEQIGAVNEKISTAEEQVELLQEALSELELVRGYVAGIDSIQANIFNRDGPVATSLRSWALDTISNKSSEYLTMLNTKIHRIQLSEKTRDVSIACHSRKEMLDLESLSGGEQVSVALALRLGMASLLGASNFSLMILDEPTTHLDAERKKSLVGVLSQLTEVTNAAMPTQFIIITHDEEIFEDSTVERIYRFKSTEEGSRVVSL